MSRRRKAACYDFESLELRRMISGGPWGQVAKILPNDGLPLANFGESVGISGNIALVGRPFDNNIEGNIEPGSAYLFNVTTGAQIDKLQPADGAPDDWFGYSVALSGNTALVSSLHDDDNGQESGSAYLFNATTGAQIAKLKPADGAELDYFGTSVAISGHIALVGSYLADESGFDSGSAYLFNATSGAQIGELRPADLAADDLFGAAVAVSGNIALVGSPWDDDNGGYSGSAYLFNATTGAQIAKLKPTDGAEGDEFGNSVALDGNIALVASDSRYGVYVFDITTGDQIAKLTPGDLAAGDRFGSSVAISVNTALVGSERDDNRGSAYLFDVTGAQMAKLTAADGASGDVFGRSVAISGDTVVAGSPGDDDNGDRSGSAYIFELDDDDDGLLDSWESQGGGIDSDGNGTIDLDLYALGARPDKKDLFVEVDTMVDRDPTQATLNRVEDAFESSAVSGNPDGTTGVRLHAILDETNVPLRQYPNGMTDFQQDKADRFGSTAQRTDPNASAILAAKRLAYRYCIFADQYLATINGQSTWGSSGLGEYSSGLGGNDFMVTLGTWTDGPDDMPGTSDDVAPGGTPDQQAATFMHELGHTLGLGHGGSDDTPYKVNYYSVMNYSWQTPKQTYGPWRLDYSSSALPSVDEASVSEASGFGLPAGTTLPIWSTTANGWKYVAGSGPIDLNGDGDAVDTLSYDLNGPQGNDGLVPHHGSDDWSRLKHNPRGSPGYFFNGIVEENELTAEINRALAEAPVVAPVVTFDPTVDLAARVYFPREIDPATVSASDLEVTNQTIGQSIAISEVTVSSNAEMSTAAFSLELTVPDGNYLFLLRSGAVLDFAGVGFGGDVVLQGPSIFVLSADANRDRTVDTVDFNILAANFSQSGKFFSQGNFDYDPAGVIDTIDFGLLSANFGKTLSSSSARDARPAASVLSAAVAQRAQPWNRSDETPASMFSDEAIFQIL